MAKVVEIIVPGFPAVVETVTVSAGAQGPKGDKGDPGLAGNSPLIYSGVGEPIEPAMENDLYLDTATGNLYKWIP